MNHYEVLGVPRDATAEQIRRAYLRLARLHHPDFHASSEPHEVEAAERRMRAVNAAWEELRTDASRRRYDQILTRADIDAAAAPPPVRRPSTEFRPYHEVDEDDDDSWRFEPDQGDPASAPPRALIVAPPLLLALGVVTVLASLTVGMRQLTAVGVAALVLAGLTFVGAPVVALFRSQITEERASRRR